ncbi:hypothetical protein TCAL_03214 [Tigriopus californicus]|uniref:Isochorismatase-like domain-containing protein n=1 Tax=Tigriopus californicus TaxID=6832 RepID=A0A553NTU8_TIGCA|nr:isochorismatase domain-containing protein 2A-like [Tigriopus californicus]TRY68851.1 hypothetical protein TCAL_03214 [Tigriopus californicus]|eukprot:TCALIF_03214-PA protein Name:"Similar to ISOC2 Isochorismatase domain-containing protein 2, mitochondrial (Macaca fascicularis)" AED:0.02 eAED:0.02 QI:0/-1/0/1/-1/1/1/0/204
MSIAGHSVRRGLGRISASTSALFLCDMQEKFRPMISYFDEVVHNSNRVLHAAKTMSMPALVTEQYPKGLGRTVPELEIAKYGLKPFEKTCFSMVIPNLMSQLSQEQNVTKSVILCGIETHACILHTTLDLLERDVEVHVLVDCCSSRSMTDRKYAFERLRDMGAFLTTSECVILGLTADSAHPKFKALQKLVYNPAPDTGLLKM